MEFLDDDVENVDGDKPAELSAEVAAFENHANPGAGGDDTAPGEAKPEIETSTLLKMLLGPLLAIRFPHNPPDEDELTLLADAWGKVLDKYFPDLNVGVELNAALVTVMFLAPRVVPPVVPADEEGEPNA